MVEAQRLRIEGASASWEQYDTEEMILSLDY